eukprot:g14591.t2
MASELDVLDLEGGEEGLKAHGGCGLPAQALAKTATGSARVDCAPPRPTNQFGFDESAIKDDSAHTNTTNGSEPSSNTNTKKRLRAAPSSPAMSQWHTPAGCQQPHPVPFSGYFGTSTTSTGAGGATAGGGVFSPSTDVFQEHLPLEMLMDVAPLDRGGFCVVCSCTYLGQRAVLKVPKLDGPDSAVADLLMEINIYKRISERGGHPNIAKAYGSGFHLVEGKPTPFLVLELLEGGNLAKALERSRPSSDTWSDPVPRLPVALELADAMQFLHFEAVPSGFVLHRDLKPTNIGLCADGHVKLFDLGLSVVQEVRQGSIDQKYEMSGMAGSKRFMSPEVCKGLPYNEKVDVYSFGIVLWELCTLRKPFAGMSVDDHYREVIIGGLRPPLDPRWPAGLQHLLRACWNEDPDQRPSILEAKEALRRTYLARGGWGC